jgi:hypothetical protein
VELGEAQDLEWRNGGVEISLGRLSALKSFRQMLAGFSPQLETNQVSLSASNRRHPT